MNKKMSFISDDFRMSQENCGNGWVMPYSHYHVSHEIYILESGGRIVSIEDKDYTVRAHDATLFSSNMPHRSRGEVPFAGICLHFSEKYLDAYFSEAGKKSLMKCFQYRVISLSEEDFKRIKYFADNFKVYGADNFVVLATILSILNHSALPVNETAGSEKKKTKAELVLNYVNENYVRIKQISEITERFAVSENYVFQIFRKRYSMTPKQYINELRIRNACLRLHRSESSVRTIASECGFESYEYFVRVFKGIAGCTPTQYRERETAGIS